MSQGSDDADLRAPERPLGQLSNKFPIDLNNPKANIPTIAERNKDPIQFGYWLMDLTVLADNALRKENYAEAAKFFEALVLAVPNRAIAHSKLCRAYLGMKDLEKAAEPCKKALAFEGAMVDDHVRFSRLLMSKPGTMSEQDISDIDAQVQHLHNGKTDLASDRIACELAVRLDDEKRLQTCTAGLTKNAPDELSTVSFQWALAIKKGQFDRAQGLIQRAAQLGMTQDGLDRMYAGMEKMQPLWRVALTNWRYVLGGLMFAIAALVLLITWRRANSAGDEQHA